jgi:hypothetical protein
MTLVGNFTLLAASWLLWRSSKGGRQKVEGKEDEQQTTKLKSS